jgi:tetratricopeptide (TPR) repeat protein
MPYILLIIVLLVLAKLPVEAAELKGVILANELSGPPIADVGIVADGANPDTSEDFGRFTLEFPQKKPGDRVQLVVKQEGYVVVNDVQLQLTLPAEAEDQILTIILCKADDREEMARRYYRLKSFEAIEESYRERLKELEDTQQTAASAMTKLQQERDQAKAAAEKASEELAKNQPGQSSELYQQAKRLFLAGKIDEAIQLLDDEKLHQALAEAKNAIKDIVQDWLLKAHLLTVQLRFDDAENAYLQAIVAEPDSFEANFAYALFIQNLHRFEQAKAAYGRCLEWARKNGKDGELSTTLNNLAVLDSDQGRMEEARKEFAEALQTYRDLAQKNPETYRRYVATMVNNLGVLDSDQGRMEEARKEFAEALQIRRELAQKNSEIYRPDVAATLNNLGVLDSDQGRMEEARKEFAEALQTYRDLAQKNPETYRPDAARTLNNVGILDRDQSRMEEARKEYAEALQTYREFAQKNPETYRPDAAATLNNMGILDRDQGRMEEARQEYAEALQTYETLARQDSTRFSADVARVKKLLEELGR